MEDLLTTNGEDRPSLADSRLSNFALRTVVLLNLLLVALSWSTWFEGDERHSGVADLLFGGLRLGGFRADLVWIFLSSFLLTVPLLYFFERRKESKRASVNLAFCFLGILTFGIYLCRLPRLLWFG